MNKNCDITIRRAANGYVVEPRADKACSERVAGGWMVFDTLERLADWLRLHYGLPDSARNAMLDADTLRTMDGFQTAEPVRWGRS